MLHGHNPAFENMEMDVAASKAPEKRTSYILTSKSFVMSLRALYSSVFWGESALSGKKSAWDWNVKSDSKSPHGGSGHLDRTPSIGAILNLCDPLLFGFVLFLNIRGTKVKSKQFDFLDGHGNTGVHMDILMGK